MVWVIQRLSSLRSHSPVGVAQLWLVRRLEHHMKKFAFILGLVLIAAALVAVGWWLGFRERYLTEAYSVTTLDKYLTDAGTKAMLLHEMDVGRPDDVRRVREMLRLELDGDILMVDSLLDSSDARSRDLARKVFARIAAYRAEYPTNYPSTLPEADAKIAEILRRATEGQSK
jgi:hypothetical protein